MKTVFGMQSRDGEKGIELRYNNDHDGEVWYLFTGRAEIIERLKRYFRSGHTLNFFFLTAALILEKSYNHLSPQTEHRKASSYVSMRVGVAASAYARQPFPTLPP
jgi:hypothetical protein